MISRRVFTGSAVGAVAAMGNQTRRVAITLDDGPVVGTDRDLATFQRITAELIRPLEEEKVPATVFINERQLHVAGERDERIAVLRQWLDAGFELGNHTYSHPDLNRVPLWQYQDDIIRGEVIMRSLLAERGQKLEWFRHPFLHTGTTAEVRQALDAFLAQRGYRVAPVTVDYSDYAFAGVYVRQLRAGDPALADRLRQAYQEQVDAGFEHYEKMSRDVLGYELPQILLIHCNALNAVSLPATIARLRKRGYTFVSLSEAMKDPAYERVDTYVGTDGMPWLRRWALAMGKPIPPEGRLQRPSILTELSGRSR